MKTTALMFGEVIRLTKTGEVHKADQTRVIRGIITEIESATRQWEFYAGFDGINSDKAVNERARIDSLEIQKNEFRAKFKMS